MNVNGAPPIKLSPGPQRPDDDARLRKTATQMEGLFVQKMFAAMRDTVGGDDGVLPRSSAEDNFTQLLDEKFAEQVPAQFAGSHSLAQALYKSVDVGQEIPPHLYRAVAEILAYIFKLMNGKLPG